MTDTVVPSSSSIRWERRRASLADGWRRLRSDKLALISLVVLIGFAVVAIATPWFTDKSDISAVNTAGNPTWAPPSREFILGTDYLGRSVALQVLWGSRVSLFVGLMATLLTIGIGTFVGITAGFFGGWTDSTMMRVTDWFLVIPFLPTAIVLAAVLSRSLWTIVFVIGITSWPSTARLLRSQVLSVRSRLYVDRARALGGGRRHLISRHVLPNVMPLVMASTTLAVPISILTETTLSFLGLGDPTAVSWGAILNEAREKGAVARGAWWYYMPPGIAIVMVVLAFTLLGRALETVLDPPIARSMSLLELRDLHVTYRSARGAVPAVRGVSLSMDAGDTLGLAGESGCGKSTIAGAILRLLPKETEISGQVLLDGEDVYEMKPGRLRAVRWTGAAIVFQGALHSLNPVQRVGKQIEEAVLLHTKVSPRAARARAQDLLVRVGIPADRLDRYPHQMSGGQRQRVLIALALACDPQLLIADEPTTALDVMVQAQVLALLEELQREKQLALLFITHDLSVLTHTCERLAVMYAGRVVEEGPSELVFSDPQHPYSRGLAAAFPTIGDLSSRMNPRGLAGDPPDPASLPPGCPFHLRCPVAIDECMSVDVALRDASAGRRAACVHVGATRV